MVLMAVNSVPLSVVMVCSCPLLFGNYHYVDYATRSRSNWNKLCSSISHRSLLQLSCAKKS